MKRDILFKIALLAENIPLEHMAMHTKCAMGMAVKTGLVPAMPGDWGLPWTAQYAAKQLGISEEESYRLFIGTAGKPGSHCAQLIRKLLNDEMAMG